MKQLGLNRERQDTLPDNCIDECLKPGEYVHPVERIAFADLEIGSEFLYRVSGEEGEGEGGLFYVRVTAKNDQGKPRVFIRDVALSTGLEDLRSDYDDTPSDSKNENGMSVADPNPRNQQYTLISCSNSYEVSGNNPGFYFVDVDGTEGTQVQVGGQIQYVYSIHSNPNIQSAYREENTGVITSLAIIDTYNSDTDYNDRA